MQTGTKRGMQTMEQSLADLVLRRVDHARGGARCSSRPDQLVGLLERAGYEDDPRPSRVAGLRACGSRR